MQVAFLNQNTVLIDPLDVDELHNLMSRCYLVMTDSGGLQEEAPSLGKPVLVLRTETERPEAVYAGTVKMAGCEYDEIYKLARELLTSEKAYNEMAHAVNPYGDGKASERIVDALRYSFGLSTKAPEEFSVELCGKVLSNSSAAVSSTKYPLGVAYSPLTPLR